MGAQSTVRRTFGRACPVLDTGARRLIPLAAALLLAALVAIPASNVALAQAPPDDSMVLVNAGPGLRGAQEEAASSSPAPSSTVR